MFAWTFLLASFLPFVHGWPSQSYFHDIDFIDPYPDRPRLSFSANGTFKITVFSDLHFGEKTSLDQQSLKLMRTILDDEKPDYVVINGDLLTGEEIRAPDTPQSLLDSLLTPIVSSNTPFSTTQGNHDNAFPAISHSELIQYEREAAPLSYTRPSPEGIGGEGGQGNYWVPVYKNREDTEPILILWFFDSRGSMGAEPVPLPQYVDPSVADWIASETERMNFAWGSGQGKRGALAFVHIPPNVVESLQPGVNPDRNPGLNDDPLGSGSVQNSPGDAKFYDAVTSRIDNLHAIISGHAHGNEWCAREPSRDIIFCFNKHSGYGGYDSPGWNHGVRNIVFEDFNTTGDVRTWIRYEDGQKRASVVLNTAYGR